jgi:DNA-binding transcriptional regulator WhiA
MSFLSKMIKHMKALDERLELEEIRIRKLMMEERLKKINKLKGLI